MKALPKTGLIGCASVSPEKRFLINHLKYAAWSLLLLTYLVAFSACGKLEDQTSPVTTTKSVVVDDSSLFKGRPIGMELEGNPWIAHVKAVDLDQDGRMDILACEAQKSELLWLRNNANGEFEEYVLANGLKAPVHAETADLDGDGDLDILVSSMGFLFPNNDRIGTLFALENDGAQNFKIRKLLENVARITDARAGDFNGDGYLDLVLAQFGYDQGEVRWMEHIGPWQYKSHQLLDLSGAINVCIADMDGNNTLDIVTIISQQWEEVYLFQNDGTGSFTSKIIFGSTNEEFNSSGISLCDLNKDGLIDVLYTNGDGFGPTILPGPRPWHGVQWLENKNDGNFQYHLVGKLPGAYSPVGLDVDGDGATDVLAVSTFNDWSKPKAVSLMWFRNDGSMNFTPRSLAYQPTHLLGLAVGDFDGSGKPSFVTGGFHAYPPYDRKSRLMLWRKATSQ